MENIKALMELAGGSLTMSCGWSSMSRIVPRMRR